MTVLVKVVLQLATIKSMSYKRKIDSLLFFLFQERDLIKHFKIPPNTLLTFLKTLEMHYLKNVPYHNAAHAADVTQSTHVLLNSPALEVRFLIFL